MKYLTRVISTALLTTIIMGARVDAAAAQPIRQAHLVREVRTDPTFQLPRSPIASETQPWLCKGLSPKPSQGLAQIAREVSGCIFATAAHWPIPGGPGMALCIAHRESGPFMWPWAYNPSGASGIFQQMDFPSRAVVWLKRDWFPHNWVPGAFNARANIIVSIRMMHSGGLGPWGGGC